MIDLLIAILIALGCNVTSDYTEEKIKQEYYDAYVKAEGIIDSGNYKYTDTGVVIVETTGD